MRGEIIIGWYGGLFFWQNKVGIWNGLCYDIFVIFMKRAYCETKSIFHKKYERGRTCLQKRRKSKRK